MVSKTYIPKRGDIVWLNFTPQTGHEQRSKRPVVVISPREYNQKVGLGLFCPITSKEKKYPFEVKVNAEKIRGVVLADQVKSLDWTERDVNFICELDDNTVAEVIDKLSVLLITK